MPWTELRLETKSQSNPPFAKWVSRLLTEKVNKAGIAVNIAKTISI